MPGAVVLDGNWRFGQIHALPRLQQDVHLDEVGISVGVEFKQALWVASQQRLVYLLVLFADDGGLGVGRILVAFPD